MLTFGAIILTKTTSGGVFTLYGAPTLRLSGNTLPLCIVNRCGKASDEGARWKFLLMPLKTSWQHNYSKLLPNSALTLMHFLLPLA